MYVIPCGDLENQHYIQIRAETIYVSADTTPGYEKCSYEGVYHPCSIWDMIGWMTTPGEYSPLTYLGKRIIGERN
jgi:hypothetical protein